MRSIGSRSTAFGPEPPQAWDRWGAAAVAMVTMKKRYIQGLQVDPESNQHTDTLKH